MMMRCVALVALLAAAFCLRTTEAAGPSAASLQICGTSGPDRCYKCVDAIIAAGKTTATSCVQASSDLQVACLTTLPDTFAPTCLMISADLQFKCLSKLAALTGTTKLPSGCLPLQTDGQVCNFITGSGTAPNYNDCKYVVCKPLINGDFQSGATGWTTLAQAGSGGSIREISVTSTLYVFSPVNLPGAPPTNVWSSVDEHNPGSYVQYQQYGPIQPGDVLSFDWRSENFADAYYILNNMNFYTSGSNVKNQQFRVDLVAPTFSDWFGAVSSSTVVAPVLSPSTVQQQVGNNVGQDLAVNTPWMKTTFDLSPFAGQTVLIAFRSVDNDGHFHSQWDNVKISNAACP